MVVLLPSATGCHTDRYGEVKAITVKNTVNSDEWRSGNPFVAVFTHTVTDQEKVRKCCVSRAFEPFTSCWSSYQSARFLFVDT